jgi:hypothetical protein
MDAGAYPVSLARMVAKERPSRVHAVAHWVGGVDHALAATIEFESGLLAQISCSFCTSVHREALIAGTGGVIKTPFLNHPPLDRPAELLVKRGVAANQDFERIPSAAMNGFLAEAESFAALVQGGASEQWEGPSPEESIDIAATLEAILQSARSGKPVESCRAVRLNSSGRNVRYRSTATNSVEGSLCSRRATSASVATPRSVAYQVINARARASRRCRDRERTSLLSSPNVQVTVSMTWSSEYVLR